MAYLLVRLRKPFAELGDLNRWRRDLLTAFDPDDFSPHNGALRIVRPKAKWEPIRPPVADDSLWLEAGLEVNYYGEGYERREPELLASVAAWLERHIPGAEVWYGHDVDDANFRRFDKAAREELLAYFRAVGNEPYRSRSREPGRR